MDYAVNEMDLDEGSTPVRPHPYPRGADRADTARRLQLDLHHEGACRRRMERRYR
jgi:hypothetical protein